MKITPHTIFIYSSGNFLRIVRGDHTTPDIAKKPRVYPTVAEALENEHRPRIVEALKRFPSDRLLDKRLKKLKEPVKISSHRPLADLIKSPQFMFAQAGYDVKHREIAAIYHKNPMSPRGMTMVKRGDINVVRKLLKKYKKPKLREHNYQERKPKLAAKVA